MSDHSSDTSPSDTNSESNVASNPPVPGHAMPLPPPVQPPGQSAPPQNYAQNPPSPPPRSNRGGGCGKMIMFGLGIFFLIGLIGVGSLVGSVFIYSVATGTFEEIAAENWERSVLERQIGGNPKADDKIVIINVKGLIVQEADGFIARQIRRAQTDTHVKAVVLRVDSPGGTMSGSDYYLHLLKKMKAEQKIPIVVSMGSVAASGGYYVAMAGDEIFAEPSTITGSIGVIASLFDASELLKKIGIESTPIMSGDHKAMGSFLKPMTEEERIIWQRLIDENFERFKKTIVENRKTVLDENKVAQIATGQIYTANEAISHRLIDRLGFLDEAVERASRLANLDKNTYKVIEYGPRLSFMESLLESRSIGFLPVGNWLTGKTLPEFTTPRVYLLCPYTAN